MLINIYARDRNEAEEELFVEKERYVENLGHHLSNLFSDYSQDSDEFEIRIEVLDESLEEARQRSLH